MLVPNLLSVETDLEQLARAISGLDGLASIFNMVAIAQTSPPRDWIDEAQWVYQDARITATDWLVRRVDVMTQLTESFVSYADVMAACTTTVAPTDASSNWDACLSTLFDEAEARERACQKTNDALDRASKDFVEFHRKLEPLVQSARAGLQTINNDILQASLALQALHARLSSYGVDSASAAQGTAVKMASITFSIAYGAIIAGSVAAPYAAIVGTIFSIGQTTWGAIVTLPAVQEALREVAETMNHLQSDERAYVVTNHLLDQLVALNVMFTEAMQDKPRVDQYWRAEADKIGILRNALRAGTPPAQLDALTSLAIANTTWQTLSSKALAVFDTTPPATATL